MNGSCGMRLVLLGLLACSPMSRADCVDGAMRETTAAERAAWDRARESVPDLFHPPAGYKLERSEMTVPRNRRCADGGQDPLFLVMHLRFVLQGQALEETNRRC